MTRLMDKVRTGRGAAAAAALLFFAGSGVGAGAMYAGRPVEAMGPVAIRPIATVSAAAPRFGDALASVRGRVTAVYGSRFTLADASGTALIEAGRRGGSGLVSPGQTVTVQGRFGDGVLHAAYLVGADGAVTALDRGPGRAHGPHGPGGPGGPKRLGEHPRRGDAGGPGGPDRAPPPPAGADRPAPPPSPAGDAGPAADGPEA